MIAFVGYVLLVSLLLVTAATASETFLRATHRPTRSVWLAAILATCMLALSVMLVTPSAAVPQVTAASIPGIVGTSGRTDVTDVSLITPPSGDQVHRLVRQAPRSVAFSDEAEHTTPRLALLAAGGWLLASLVCLVRLLAGARRVARLRRSCRPGLLHGEPVLVSGTTGPAVLGVLRHQIVIPAWVESLGEEEQRLILAHEREHIRARDPLVLHAASVVIALMPWNLPLWFALHRLRDAMEIDCDARVLRHQVGAARRYCRLLLEVGERTVAVASPLLALAERATPLERRIESMTTPPKLRDWKTLLPAAGAMLLLAGACRAPRPEIGPAEGFGLVARARATLAARRSDAVEAPVVPARTTAPLPLPAAAAQRPGLDVRRTPAAPAIARTRDFATSVPTSAGRDTVPDTTIRNEAALRRSAAEHQARVDAIADSVILADYPELTRRPPGTPAFLALVLDDRDKLIRHAVSLDPALPNDLAATMLAMRIDTISGRTLGLGISANNRWDVTVGYAAEALGPVRGHTVMRAWRSSPLPYALRRVPYERIVDSVARARAPDAYREHEGIFAIAMLLGEDGSIAGFAAQPHANPAVQSEMPLALMKRMLGDTTLKVGTAGVMGRVQPARTAIVWGVRR